MPTSLRVRLGELAASFASNVIDAIRGASLEDLLAESSGSTRRALAQALGRGDLGGASRRRPGRLPRRSAGDIERVVARIVDLLRQNPKGLRAEQIREKLGLQAKELPRPLKEALDSGRLAKSGQKRATTYVLKSAGASKGRGASGARSTRRRAAAAATRKGRNRSAKRSRPVEKKAPVAQAGTESSPETA